MPIYNIIIAFIVGSILHFVIQKIFIFYKKFDAFNQRSSHMTLATRTGGIGLFFTLLILSTYNYLNGVEIFDYSLFIPLGIMFFIGVYDDFYNADFKLKFFLQIIVAKILIDQGLIISNYYGLFGLYEIPHLLAQITTVFVFLVIVNSINFIDGIDGLAISQIIKSIFLIELFSLQLTPLAPLSFIVLAAILPLYYFNFKKTRKVFLGDSGSLFLGTIISIYIFFILGNDFYFLDDMLVNKTLFTILILIYPLIDLLRVFILRLRNKKSPFYPDKNHLHHLSLKKLKNKQGLTVVFIQLSELLLFFTIFFIYKKFQ